MSRMGDFIGARYFRLLRAKLWFFQMLNFLVRLDGCQVGLNHGGG